MRGLLLAFLAFAAAAPAAAVEKVDYLRDVKPILSARCVSCHGAIRQKAGLRLDTAELARRGGDGGPAVVPGKAEESPLIDRVASDDPADRMPPESEGVPLSAAEVAVLRAWIDAGAPAPAEPTPEDPRRHWAYQVPRRPDVPGAAGAGNPIDAFLAAAQAAAGVAPNPPARPEHWLRRVTLDLIGLPATPDDARAFLDDRAPDARRRVVERLLASPRHGERWARHWMDVWRYSDWYGLGQELRYSHPHIWRWRDWIVESVNADKGYDRMVVEMLAGDEAAPDDPDTLRATGFLARQWDIFNRNAWLASTVEHTSRAFLGVTLQCARCHDHKFDPIGQAEYYRFRAFFEPYHIRIDRVPGQPDRLKDGLSRAFDDFNEAPTYLFVRGEETRPDTSRPLTPATPAVLGGEARVVPVPLPPTAAVPDKRPFVIRELREEARGRVVAARAAVVAAGRALDEARRAETKALDRGRAAAGLADEARRKAEAEAAAGDLATSRRTARDAEEDREVAEAALAAAEAGEREVEALLLVERIEDEGGKSARPDAWAEAARGAVAAQRALATLRAAHDRRAAVRDGDRARRTLDAFAELDRSAGAVARSKEAVEARAKAAAAAAEADRRAEAAEAALAKAREAESRPIDEAYTPRPLVFHRAKTTYRDTPKNDPYPTVSTGRRLALARWIADGRNPLTARVAVNHVWARHFGEPLVPSVFDFGLRAPRPPLLDLLDWLAVELIESGWSLKHLHRLIVTSDAYARSSADGGPGASLDPDNRLFWRMNPRRMEGELIRDSLLSLAGRLDGRMGGPDIPVAAADADADPALGSRRTLYYRYTLREHLPFLTPFDFANPDECYRRHETIVPQQALAMVNSKEVLARAGEIAARIDREEGVAAPGRFVRAAFERLLGRPPTPDEAAECDEALGELARLHGDGPTATARARSALVHVLLNHNDFVTIR